MDCSGNACVTNGQWFWIVAGNVNVALTASQIAAVNGNIRGYYNASGQVTDVKYGCYK